MNNRKSLSVRIPIGRHGLPGDLESPLEPHGLVLFAHGSGSSRHSPRNQYVAGVLKQEGFATLLIDLLTEEEEAVDARTGRLRFDVDMLAERLVTIIDWLRGRPETAVLPIGLFGASTGGGAALVAAAMRPHDVDAVVSRGGRPDLAGGALPRVSAPTLLIVGGLDALVIQMNCAAMAHMRGEVKLDIVPGATHLFEEPGALGRVAALAAEWFSRYLNAQVGRLPMQTIEIPQRDWSARLDEFSRIHEGWLVSLDIMAQSIGAQPEFRQLPLVGITAEPSDGGTISIAVAEPTGEHLTHTIHSPTHVFIEKTNAGANVALEIESADGTKAVLRFRTTALPETVDDVVGGKRKRG